MATRIEIENALIATIVFADGFAQVANYLAAETFANELHRQIFEAAQALYPTAPVDLLTVCTAVKELYPDSFESAVNFLLEISAVAIVPVNASYWALLLMQIDLTEKFHAQLIRWAKECKESLRMIELHAINQVMFTLTKKDVIRAIDQAESLFSAMKMKQQLEVVIGYYYKIMVQVSAIRINQSLSNAAKAVIAAGEAGSAVSYEVQRFSVAIANMIVTNQVRPEYTEAANLLKKAN